MDSGGREIVTHTEAELWINKERVKHKYRESYG